MKTIDQLRTERDEAGAQYAAAANALFDAWVEVAAREITLRTKGVHTIDRFYGPPDVTSIPRHGEYLRNLDPGRLGDRVIELHEKLLTSLKA